jgi:pimeloyl-ACP methyl ester carboxylesterase
MWTEWVEALKGRYRVVRFDRPPMGLSGPDPGGNYSSAREAEIIGRLTEKLGIPRFFLVGTSSAGVSTVEFAAEHPERVRGLILSNIAVGPFAMDSAHLPLQFQLVLKVDRLLGGWHPEALWRGVLLANIVHSEKVTPELISEWTQLNNRAQRMPGAALARLDLDSTPHDLPRIGAPTLLLWSAEDRELPAATVAPRALALLASADKHLEVIPACGHMMPLDCGAESVSRARAFLDRVSTASE